MKRHDGDNDSVEPPSISAIAELVSKAADAERPRVKAEDALGEYIEETSDVAARALQAGAENAAKIARIESALSTTAANADAAKQQSTTLAIRLSVATAALILALTFLGWVLITYHDQLRHLEAAAHTAAPVVERAVADIAESEGTVRAAQQTHDALERRVRDLEEQLRNAQRELGERKRSR